MGMLSGSRDKYGPGFMRRMLSAVELGRPAACRTGLISGIPAVALVTKSTQLNLGGTPHLRPLLFAVVGCQPALVPVVIQFAIRAAPAPTTPNTAATLQNIAASGSQVIRTF